MIDLTMTARLSRWSLLFLPGIVLVVLAIPRFFSGLALDATFPVPAGIATSKYFSPVAYAETAAYLALADVDDGETQIMRAEALWRLKKSPQLVRRITWQSLERSPASILGWVLQSEASSESDPDFAAKALAVAIDLSPHDYWLLARKARSGATLWNRLSPESQEKLASQARELWTIDSLRPQIRSVLRVPGGATLMTRALGDREEIRALNRYLTRQRMGLQK